MMHNMKTGMLLLSICYVIVGLLLLVMPAASLPWICTVLSVIILITGVVNLFQYFRLRGQGMRAVCIMVGGVVATALGVFALLRPAYVEWVLPVVFGLFVLIDGLMRFSTVWTLLRRRGQKWWVLLLLTLVTLLLGVELVTYPFLPFNVIKVDPIVLCGIILVIEGMLNMGCVIYAAMELHALDRLDKAAEDKAKAIPADAVDVTDAAAQPDIVCEAESKEVPEEAAAPTPAAPTPTAPAADSDSTDPLSEDAPMPGPELTTTPNAEQ